MRRNHILTTALAALLAVGCADDDPTGVGSSLLRGGSIQTVRLELDADRFLVDAATAAGYSGFSSVGFVVLADEAGGELDAHALGRFAPPPAVVEYTDADGEPFADSTVTYIGGNVVMHIDLARSTASGPVELQLYGTAEAWDPETASWTWRVDSAGQRTPWTDPGGTTGPLLATAEWEPGADSVVFPVDSQTVAAWTDTTDATRGALVAVDQPGARLVAPTGGFGVRLTARPSVDPDTTVTVVVGLDAWTSVFDPPPATDGRLLVGGVPSWRSFLRFDDRLDSVTVAVVRDGETVRVPLNRVTVNRATLLLDPEPAPAGFVPEDSVMLDARAVMEDEGIPLSRSPLGRQSVGRPDSALVPELFTADPPVATVELPVTNFITGLLSSEDEPRAVALVRRSGAPTFGVATFAGPDAGARAPRLRLTVTVATEVQIE